MTEYSTGDLLEQIEKIVALETDDKRHAARIDLLHRMLNATEPPEEPSPVYSQAAMDPKEIDIDISIVQAIRKAGNHPAMVTLEGLYEQLDESQTAEQDEVNRFERAAAVLIHVAEEHAL